MAHPSVEELLRSFCAGASSRDVLEGCLPRIADTGGEGSRTFTRVYAAAARAEADAADTLYRTGAATGPLAGVPVSVKDLFDVVGDVTTAGSRVLADAPPAGSDAAIVERLRSAGAVIVGRTNMTEFAYSGVGLNPHYGTPKNPYRRERALIPGGSSSGAAVSVTDGMAAVAIGTDTGGSVRIPAALCGLVGFKPTARRVPMDGTLPLAPSLDSIGPIGHTVACCARVDAVLAGSVYQPMPQVPMSGLRLGVLQGYVLDGLDSPTAAAFDRAMQTLGRAGAKLEAVPFPALARIPASNQTAATEAYAWHRTLLERSGHRYDPHVSARILHGAGVLAADYLDLMRARREIIRDAERAFEGFDAILLPTTPRIAPPIAALEASDAVYFDVNGAMLRNTSIFNFLDGCGLSVPCHGGEDAPVGLMLAGLGGWDARILGIGAAVETALASV